MQARQEWERNLYLSLQQGLPERLPERPPQGPRTRTSRRISLPERLMQCDRDISELLPKMRQIPRAPPECRLRFCLLLFSGTRRSHDVPYHLEKLQRSTGWTVIPVLLDLGVSEDHGNLLHRPTQRLWLQKMHEGLVCYLHLAPPLRETWSVARENPKGRINGKPRPLRTFDWLCGRLDRDLKELQQTVTGNALLMVSILFLLWASVLKIAWSLEHPAGKSTSAGIWHTATLKRLRRLGLSEWLLFLQGLMGAVSAKPTIFAASKDNPILTLIQERIKQWTRPMPRNALIGKEKGTLQWKTHKAKQYPSTFCWCIAMAAILEGGPPAFDAETSRHELLNSMAGAFRPVLEALWPSEYSEVVAPDYHHS